jgi:hypothetical protein
MSNGSTMKITPISRVPESTDWTEFDAMTAEERHAAAMSDPDNRPLTEEDFKRMKRVPRAKTIRRALGLALVRPVSQQWKGYWQRSDNCATCAA